MKLLNSEKYIVGYDLSDDFSQISYVSASKSNVETVSSVAGEDIYGIPTVLCKREGSSQWSFGREALRLAEEENGILVENLLSLAVDGEPLQVEGESFQPVSLLTLFVKRSLSLLASVVPQDKIYALVVTCEKMDERMLAVLEQVVAGLGLRTPHIRFQSHRESFYHFMLFQPQELRQQQTFLFEYRRDGLLFSRLVCNRRTRPVAVHVEETKYPFPPYVPLPEEEGARKNTVRRLDGEFLELLDRLCCNQLISSVYLIGEGFAENWMEESLRYLCRGRRVFQGNNLYSKGACYGMLERQNPGEEEISHVFLGPETLKSNIGMRVWHGGKESYYPLLDAGVNWFDAKMSTELYLQEGNRLALQLTSLTGGKSRLVEVGLEGLPEGPARLQLQLCLKDENRLMFMAEDLGFGVFRPAAHQVWEQELELG